MKARRDECRAKSRLQLATNWLDAAKAATHDASSAQLGSLSAEDWIIGVEQELISRDGASFAAGAAVTKARYHDIKDQASYSQTGENQEETQRHEAEKEAEAVKAATANAKQVKKHKKKCQQILHRKERVQRPGP